MNRTPYISGDTLNENLAAQTIRLVAVCRRHGEGPYLLQIDRDDVGDFVIPETDIVQFHDELVEGLSWSAEIRFSEALLQHLQQYSIFPVIETENGYSQDVDNLIESRFALLMAQGPSQR